MTDARRDAGWWVETIDVCSRLVDVRPRRALVEVRQQVAVGLGKFGRDRVALVVVFARLRGCDGGAQPLRLGQAVADTGAVLNRVIASDVFGAVGDDRVDDWPKVDVAGSSWRGGRDKDGRREGRRVRIADDGTGAETADFRRRALVEARDWLRRKGLERDDLLGRRSRWRRLRGGDGRRDERHLSTGRRVAYRRSLYSLAFGGVRDKDVWRRAEEESVDRRLAQ